MTDLRSFRIPNWLTFSGVGLGLLLNAGLGALEVGGSRGLIAGFVSALAGGGFLLLTFGLLGAIRFVGMGDVKLMAAVGTLLRWPTALWALAYVAAAGGVLGLGYTLISGRARAVFGNLLRISGRVVGRGADPEMRLHRIPYALAILAGASWAALIKYFPALRVP